MWLKLTSWDTGDWEVRGESEWGLQFSTLLQGDQVTNPLSRGRLYPPEGWGKEINRSLPLPSPWGMVCSCSVLQGLFLVEFFLITFREFHLGIPTRVWYVGVKGQSDGFSPALLGKPGEEAGPYNISSLAHWEELGMALGPSRQGL